MSLEWKYEKLGKLCSFDKEGVNPKEDIKYYHYSFPAFDNNKEPEVEVGKDIKSSKFLFNKGDILFNKLNVKFKRVWDIDFDIDENSICSTEFIPIQAKNIDRNFLYYCLISPNFTNEMKYLSTGTSNSHQRINPKDIKDYDLFLPTDEEIQKKIGYILKLLDKKISMNVEINKNLDDILDSIFKENFIKEFDNDNNDWKIKNIGELPLIITDYVANGSFASLKENVTILDYEEYAYFIRNTDLKSKSFQKFVNKHSYDFLKKSSLFGNEVIISNVGDVGSVFLCPFLDKPMTLGNNMILVKSRDDAINLNFYLFLLFRSNYGQYLISTITAGSVQSKFNKTEFKSLELTMPNDELIIKFNNLVSPIFDYKNKISDEIVRLTKLRDTLLPKLMSGEIDVSKINCDLELKYNYMKYLFNQIHTPMSKSVV